MTKRDGGKPKDFSSVAIQRFDAENVFRHPRHAERKSSCYFFCAGRMRLIILDLDDLEVAVRCFAQPGILARPDTVECELRIQSDTIFPVGRLVIVPVVRVYQS